jgi:site-specific recombinase XerD
VNQGPQYLEGRYTLALPSPSRLAISVAPSPAVKALRGWLDARWYRGRAVVPSDQKAATVAVSRLTCRSVANIIKAYAERAGFDACTFSGHSLRAGFLTSAAGNGASIFKMMDVSRHKSVDTLRGYVRDAELFKDHAGTGLL